MRPQSQADHLQILGVARRMPAAGAFPGWPARVAEVTVMDPCCGSGHFLVAAHEMLWRMRMEEEGLDAAAASDAVLRDNLFGLELDPRCTQIAAFALALAAWKAGGYRELPLPNIACSGIAVGGRVEEWTRLAGEDARLAETLERLYYLFRDAPTLGSLINPAAVPLQQRLFSADYAEVEPLLKRALSKRRAGSTDDPAAAVFGAAAEGIARAATLLSGTYTLVATNVPYLARYKQSETLSQFCSNRYPESKSDLATVFIDRCSEFASSGGSYAVVCPQNWLFLSRYKRLRRHLLAQQTWNAVVRLGSRAFETITGEIVNVTMLVMTNLEAPLDQAIIGLDVADGETVVTKIALLQSIGLQKVSQASQLRNPDVSISLVERTAGTLLGAYATAHAGLLSGDYPRFGRCFWELPLPVIGWNFQQSTVKSTIPWGGREHVCFWQNGRGEYYHFVRERL